MLDHTSIGAAYAKMHTRWQREQRNRGAALVGAGFGLALGLFMVAHLLGDLGARVAADVARGATEYCGRC